MTKMKGRPDTSAFHKIQSLDNFLDDGAADLANRNSVKTAEKIVAKSEPLIQKIFRLRKDTVCALRTGSSEESNKTGKRVSETEIVEKLIRQHFKLDSK